MTAISAFPNPSASSSAPYGVTPGPDEIGFANNLPGTRHEVTHVYADACRSANKLEPIGNTVDDLLAALDAQESTDVVVTQLAAGSFVGRRVAVTQAAGVDRSACSHGTRGPLQIWANEAQTDYFAFAPGHRGVVYAFDVDGARFVFSAYFGPETTEADVAEVDELVQSFEFSTP
jgi:hypothetical protein